MIQSAEPTLQHNLPLDESLHFALQAIKILQYSTDARREDMCFKSPNWKKMVSAIEYTPNREKKQGFKSGIG